MGNLQLTSAIPGFTTARGWAPIPQLPDHVTIQPRYLDNYWAEHVPVPLTFSFTPAVTRSVPRSMRLGGITRVRIVPVGDGLGGLYRADIAGRLLVEATHRGSQRCGA